MTPAVDKVTTFHQNIPLKNKRFSHHLDSPEACERKIDFKNVPFLNIVLTNKLDLDLKLINHTVLLGRQEPLRAPGLWFFRKV